MMNRYSVVGLMSGTSMDGVDIALCVFEKSKAKWNFEIKNAETIAYTAKQRRNLANVGQTSASVFAAEHVAYGRFLGNLVHEFLQRKKAKADFVSSHGHTVFHQPHKRFTTQIGDGAALSAACGLPVVCDFRSADVALRGQGAPLVPIGDKFLFNSYTSCLNLGGIANISFDHKGNRIAFDICPVNIVMNSLALKLGRNYDKGGKIAQRGKIQAKLLKKLNAVPFYKRQFPKSLGREDIEKYFFSILDNDHSSPEDKLCTFCEHIAIQISDVANRIGNAGGSMLVTGGGAYNSFLIDRMKAHCKSAIVLPGKQIIEFKEALIFAFLGTLRWRNEINCLHSVTGASRDSSGGAIYHP